MTFKKEYLETFDERNRLQGLLQSYNEKPHSAVIRQEISSELYKDPTVLRGVTSDIVDNYVNTDIVGKFENKIQKIHGLTESNLDRILDDLTSTYKSVDDALNLIMNLPSHNVEGGRYVGMSNAHIKAKEAYDIHSSKNVESVVKTLIENYDLSKESIAYHANADSEGLIDIFGKTVVKSRTKKLGEKLSDEKGNLDKTKSSNFAKYLVNKSEDKEKAYSLELVSQNAFEMYRPKEEQK